MDNNQKREAAELLNRAKEMLKHLDQMLLVTKAEAYDMLASAHGECSRPEPLEISARRLTDECDKFAHYLFHELQMEQHKTAGSLNPIK